MSELSLIKKITNIPILAGAPRNGRRKKGFLQELKFNILKHVITHLYKHIGEEIVW